jgi:hypothetical protein
LTIQVTIDGSEEAAISRSIDARLVIAALKSAIRERDPV